MGELQPLTTHLRTGPLDREALLRFALAFADEVAGEHALDRVHGALHPRFVLWDGADEVELLDNEGGDELPDLSEVLDEDALDRVGYLAPEQVVVDFEHGEQAGPRTDMFRIGIVLYEAATGEHPFADPSAEDIVANIEKHNPPAAGMHRPELALEWDAMLSLCLHKPVLERYANALDLRRDLEKLRREGGRRRRDPRHLAWGRIAVTAVIVTLISVGIVLACQ